MDMSKRLNSVFFFSGLVLDFTFVVGLAAAEDITSGSSLPTSAVLLTITLPLWTMKLVLPYWLHIVSYKDRIIFIVCTAVLGLQLLAWLRDPWVRMIVGVLMLAVSTAIAELSYFALTSRYAPYHSSALVALCAGTGISGLVGSGMYLLFRQAFQLSTEITLATFSIVPPTLLLLFMIVAPVPPLRPLSLEDENQAPSTPSAATISTKTQTEIEEQRHLVSTVGVLSDDDTLPKSRIGELTTHDKVSFVWHHMLVQYMGPLCTVYFAEYLINQSVNSYVWFHDSSISENNQYVLFYFMYNCGVFLSRSSRYYIRIHNIWALALLQVACLCVFTIHLYHPFVPHIGIFCVMVLFEGCLGGATFANAFGRISEEVKRSDLKEFALTCGSAADATGVTIAAIVGICLSSEFSRHDQGS